MYLAYHSRIFTQYKLSRWKFVKVFEKNNPKFRTQSFSCQKWSFFVRSIWNQSCSITAIWVHRKGYFFFCKNQVTLVKKGHFVIENLSIFDEIFSKKFTDRNLEYGSQKLNQADARKAYSKRKDIFAPERFLVRLIIFRDSPNYNQGQYIKSYQIERPNRIISKMYFSKSNVFGQNWFRNSWSFQKIFRKFDSYFRGTLAIIEFQVFRFLFFNFLKSQNFYQNKIGEYSAVIFSNWICFLEIDRLLDHVIVDQISKISSPAEISSARDQIRKYQIFDLTLIVIVAKPKV